MYGKSFNKPLTCVAGLPYNNKNGFHTYFEKEGAATMTWYIKRFEEMSTNELYSVLKERVDVFVVEQNCPYPELDGKDLLSYHLFKEVEGEIAAYSRLLPPGVSYEEASIGRVLVKKAYRKQKLGEELLKRALDFLTNELNESRIKIQAQDYLRKFYGSFGFEVISDVYLEDGIPHVDMILSKKS